MSKEIDNTAAHARADLPSFAAYLQFDVIQGDIEKNRQRLSELLEELAPPTGTVVVLPELWATGFSYGQLPELARRTPELLAYLTKEAECHGILLAGSLPENEASGTRIFNTLFVSGPQGFVGSYRKQHLFGPMQEDRHFSPGNSPQSIVSPFGLLASLVCFDLRFPELTRLQATQGAQLLLVSAQWPAARTPHWRTLLKARAIENQLFVVACNRCGETDGTRFGGHSMIIGPDGTILKEAQENTEVGITSLENGQPAQLRAYFNTAAPRPYSCADQEKIQTLPDLTARILARKKTGQCIVFTNGCFDILHPGHVSYLEEARRLGDCLIVGVNSDSSVKSLNKGADRPINRETDRARVLAALGCVDFVLLFDEETPLHLIATLLPDILVKGGDWPVQSIVGGKEVMAAGGKVLSIPLVGGHSTTGLLTRIRE